MLPFGRFGEQRMAPSSSVSFDPLIRAIYNADVKTSYAHLRPCRHVLSLAYRQARLADSGALLHQLAACELRVS